MKEGRLPTAYRLLMIHGPLHSIQLAEMMDISRNNASSTLSYLATNGGCEEIDRVVHPDFKFARINLYRAIPGWQPRQKTNAPREPFITDADRAWMQKQRDIANARRARINESQGRV